MHSGCRQSTQKRNKASFVWSYIKVMRKWSLAFATSNFSLCYICLYSCLLFSVLSMFHFFLANLCKFILFSHHCTPKFTHLFSLQKIHQLPYCPCPIDHLTCSHPVIWKHISPPRAGPNSALKAKKLPTSTSSPLVSSSTQHDSIASGYIPTNYVSATNNFSIGLFYISTIICLSVFLSWIPKLPITLSLPLLPALACLLHHQAQPRNSLSFFSNPTCGA